MDIDYVRAVMMRDLASVRAELAAYERDAQVWALPEGLPNSAGTLALHLAGNLMFLVGAQLGHSTYVRDREAEFGDRDVPRAELDRRLAEATETIDRTLSQLDPAGLGTPFPVEVGGARPATGLFLMHLTAHLAYHLGQIDYHRRVVTGNRDPVGAMGIKVLTG